jgi:hypothetical protein
MTTNNQIPEDGMSALRNVYLPGVERRCIDERGKIEAMKIPMRPDTYERFRDDARKRDMKRAHLLRILIEGWMPILRLVVQQQVRGLSGEIAAMSARAKETAGMDKALTDIFGDRIRACAEVRLREGGLVTVTASFWPQTCRLIAMASSCYDTSANEFTGRLLDVTNDIWR